MPRIAVSASQNTGKSTFIEDFIKTFPKYKKSGESYRKLVKKQKLTLNKEGTEKSQEVILNSLLDEVMKYKKKDFIIHDRCPLDNLAYTIWLKHKNPDAISDLFVERTIMLVKESMKFIDLIFYIPILDKYPIKLEQKENREIDEIYRTEIDNIFKAFQDSYNQHKPFIFPFDSKDGVPALIEIFGSREERIEMSKLYINKNGNFYSDDESMIAPVLEEENSKLIKK